MSMRWWFALAMTMCVASDGSVAAQGTDAVTDSVEWSTLDARMAECTDAPASADVCRVRRRFTPAEIEARLAAGTDVWRTGDELTFATRGDAPGMLLGGGVQAAMSRLAGTNLWVITMRVRDVDEAFITYFFVPLGGLPMGARFVPKFYA